MDETLMDLLSARLDAMQDQNLHLLKARLDAMQDRSLHLLNARLDVIEEQFGMRLKGVETSLTMLSGKHGNLQGQMKRMETQVTASLPPESAHRMRPYVSEDKGQGIAAPSYVPTPWLHTAISTEGSRPIEPQQDSDQRKTMHLKHLSLDLSIEPHSDNKTKETQPDDNDQEIEESCELEGVCAHAGLPHAFACVCACMCASVHTCGRARAHTHTG